MKSIVAPLFATVTPFNEKGGIDEHALRLYLEFLEKAGVKSIIVNGSTGEFPSMTPKERMLNLELCRERFSGSIMANVSSSSVAYVSKLVGHANGYADALLVLPPYYYANASVEGIRSFIASGLSQAAKPVYIYNFPLHTQYTFSKDDIAWFKLHVPLLAGIKDSSGSVESACAFKEAFPELSIFVGRDNDLVRILGAELAGAATGSGNACPEFLVQLHSAVVEGDTGRADKIQALFNEWQEYRSGLDVDNVSLVKAVLDERLGRRFAANVRLPFREVPIRVRAEATELINSMLEKLTAL